MNHVAKYKDITCKGSRKYKTVRRGGGGGALPDQEMGPWWLINSSITSPEINFKCSQKQPKTKICWQVYKNIASKSNRAGGISRSRDGAVVVD